MAGARGSGGDCPGKALGLLLLPFRGARLQPPPRGPSTFAS